MDCYAERMDERLGRRPKKDHDFSISAFRVVQQVTREDEEPLEEPGAKLRDDGKNPAAVALGRLGGKKGGKARAQNLSPEQRREIAQKAAATRWNKPL